MASEDDPIPLTPEQDAELARRVAAYIDKPDQWITLEQLEAELDQLLNSANK